MRRELIGLGSALALVLGTAVGAAAEDSVPVECGDVVIGAAHLTHDLTCTGVGLVMEPGASLDLRGFTLRGPGLDSGVEAIATDPEVEGGPARTLSNGTVADWSLVMGGEFDRFAVVLSGVTVQDNGQVLGGMFVNLDAEASTFLRNGSVVQSWGGVMNIRSSTFRENSVGIVAGPYTPSISINGSTFIDNGVGVSCEEGGVRVTSSTFRGGGTAIRSWYCGTRLYNSSFTGFDHAVVTEWLQGSSGRGDEFIGNRFTGNQVALDLGVGGVIRSNDFKRNGTGVLATTAGTSTEIQELTLAGNTFKHNGDGAFIDTVVQVQGNKAMHNTGYGIYAPLAVDLGGNVARHNGNDCVGVVCAR